MNCLCTYSRSVKALLMVFSLYFTGSHALAQDVVVTGVVMNEQNVRIANAEIKLGTANVKSNSKGSFILTVNKLPAQMNVKHPSYKNYVEVVRAPLRAGDTLKLEIILEGKETELEEVTINASKIIWAYTKKNTHIIDFTLCDNEMLLVCSENHRYFLRRLDSIGKKIVDLQIRKNPLALYEDCTGGTHLVYSDSIFEIKLIRNSIGLLAGHSYLETMRILNPCMISSDDNFIVRRMGAHNQSVEYASINRNTKKPTTLYRTSNQKKMRELDEFVLRNEIVAELSDKSFRLGNQPDLPSPKQKFQNEQLYRQILQKPLYAPIFEINDSVFVFDHFIDSASVYTISGKYIRSFQINYHYFDNWKSELLLNEEKSKLYAVYEIDGLVTLREINPSTGKVISLHLLEKHIYPMHIQIRGNFAYYLYKHYLDNSIHYLYKQPITE